MSGSVGYNGPNILKDNLVFYVNPSSGYSSNVDSPSLSKDSIGGVSGTLTNGAYHNGSNGIVFDGVNDYIDYGTNPANTIRGGNKFTIAYWVKKSSSSVDFVVASWYHTTRKGFYLEWWTDGNVYFGVDSGGSGYNYAPLTWTNNWYYLCGVFDGTQPTNATKGKIYVNGSLVTNTNSNIILTSVDTYSAKFLSGTGENYGVYSGGQHGIIQLYNTVLTSGQIMDNYNATKSIYGF